MKEGIIIYKSKYGATKRYACWLQEMTGFDLREASGESWKLAASYETVLFCGGIYASGIAGLSALKKHRTVWRGKKVLILCVGASPYDEGSFQQIRSHNLTGDFKDIPLFYGRGIWDESRMTFPDRTLCRMLQKSLAKKDPNAWEPWMKALLGSAGQVCDWTDPKYLTPLLNYLKASSVMGSS